MTNPHRLKPAPPEFPFDPPMCENRAGEPAENSRGGNTKIQAAHAFLVCRTQTRPSLAPHAGPVPHLAFGNHAAADSRRGRDSLLRTIPRGLSERAGAGARENRSRAGELGGPRLLQPREKFASRGKGNCHAARGRFPARIRSGAGASGHRTLHGGGGPEHCLRRAARGAGRKRRARARADRRSARRFARARDVAETRSHGAGFARSQTLPATGTRP